MTTRMWFVVGVVVGALGVLLLTYLLTTTAYAMGKSELYGKVLEWRMQSDSTARACTR